MNERIDDLMYESGLTAQGCWDSMDKYDQEAIMKFGHLIVRECISACATDRLGKTIGAEELIKQHFGVKQ